MGKQQVWSVTACVFLFLSLASQIHCATREIGLSGANRRVSAPSTSGVVDQPGLKEKDLIKNLPGQPSDVSFKQYGGYVAINETSGRFFYYYFVESIKANDSSTPLVIWFNGGPGSSSLLGAFTEHGPFRVHSDGKKLFRNPYSWNTEAHMVYVETPARVGFSYTNTPSDMEKIGDQATAEDNYVFLVKWLERFPEYKGRETYFAGQSYAGHYAPQLAKLVLERNNQTFINLRGLLLGNPLLATVDEEKHVFEFLLAHAVIPQEFMDKHIKICGPVGLGQSNNFRACTTVTSEIEDQKKNLDEYNIYADKCLNSTLTSKPKKYATIMPIDPCSEYYMSAYLNTPNVQEAMHANTTKLPYAWQGSNGDLMFQWKQTDIPDSMLPLLSELMGKGIRIWVYSGDFDAKVPASWTMFLLRRMNLTVENTWRAWYSGGLVGGYTEDYKGNFTYATVRGAGHSVPSDQPTRALTLFTSFLRKTPLPLPEA